MTATKKSIRFLTVLALILAMVFSIISVPASAAGTETWYDIKGNEKLTMFGDNLTPIKTMGVSGILVIEAKFHVTDTLKLPDNVIYVLEIRSSDGTVLARKTALSPAPLFTLRAEAHVTSGQEVRIYTSAKCTVHDAKMNAKVEYTHEVIQ